jgi:hypothetical protein
MQYGDLEISTQVLLIGLLLVLVGSMLLRVGAVLWRKRSQVPQLYPRSWTTAQCQLMDRFCLAVGVTLSALWLAQLASMPHMPTNWPFGLESIVVLLLTNAWLILMLPRDWKLLGALTERFLVTLMTLAVWWTLMFGGTAWLLAKALSAPPPQLTLGPVVAAKALGWWAL